MGEIIDLSTHMGFVGKLDKTSSFSNGRYQLYFGDERFEVLYHVAPLMPTHPNDDQQIYKKRHIGNDNVHVVWSEHDFDYDPQTVTSQFNDAHVVVCPMLGTDRFFRVMVYKKSFEYHFGPLREEVIVSSNALATLVRWTSIFADRVARQATATYKLPQELYIELMAEMVQPMKGNLQPEHE
jgi:hypothetical protein